MSTELSFLVEILLNHKLAKSTRDLIAERVKAISESPTSITYGRQNYPGLVNPIVGPSASLPNPTGVPQSPSTLALMAKHAASDSGLAPTVNIVPTQPAVEAVQPAIIAQTPMTAMAMNDRHSAIAAAMSGKPEKGRTSPRKF